MTYNTHPGYCHWCNGHRDTLPMGMCGLHQHAADLLAVLDGICAALDDGRTVVIEPGSVRAAAIKRSVDAATAGRV